MRSGFYYGGHHRKVASRVREHINSSRDFLSPHTAGSPRAVGDAIEALVAEKFGKEIGKIRDRMDRFDSVREYWESKEDLWT